MGESRWTQVIGICSREVKGSINSHGNRMTDGVWIKTGQIWDHPKGEVYDRVWRGMNLITDSGTFKITLANLSENVVRDFTEVGWTNLPATYARVEKAMTPN